MFDFLPTLILRHKRENLKKCSLRGLEDRDDLVFLTYPLKEMLSLDRSCILTLGAPVLSEAEKDRPLLLIDGTWRYAGVMMNTIPTHGTHIYRSLPPHLLTAYPRRQPDCPDPTRGLASVEALYAAYHLLGRPTEGLLDHYHWKENFLSANNYVFE